jgi:hypothetical protein
MSLADRVRGSAIAVLSAILSLACWSSAAAVDVTACGQTIGRREVGVLVADLDCSASPFGVRLLRHATLDLNGHSIQFSREDT